ncbi:MAG: extensin-like domain-containing protein [Paracoccaceae bacterium]
MRLRLAVALVLGAGMVLAEAPLTSVRPQPRPDQTTSTAPLPAVSPVRPMPRPASLATSAPPVVVVPVQTASALTPAPMPRPADLMAPRTSASQKAGKKTSRKGRVCGDPAIKGEALSPIPAKITGCGLDEPVRVTEIAGVTLSPAATISCETAEALKSWITSALPRAFGRREVIELRVAASYICRTRNNKKGAKISEHGRGNAVDISAFILSDGKILTVEDDYGKQMRKVHKAACGPFGATLGPGSDGFHEDHLHLDIARHTSGPYCR